MPAPTPRRCRIAGRSRVRPAPRTTVRVRLPFVDMPHLRLQRAGGPCGGRGRLLLSGRASGCRPRLVDIGGPRTRSHHPGGPAAPGRRPRTPFRQRRSWALRYHVISEVMSMPDLLIRNFPADDLERLDARAAALGLSRSEYLRRRLRQDARSSSGPVSVTDLQRFAATFSDLADDAIMSQAWR